MRNTNDKDNEVWALAPAMHGPGSQRKGGKFASQTQLKTAGKYTDGGDGNASCLCIPTHTAPLQKGESGHTDMLIFSSSVCTAWRQRTQNWVAVLLWGFPQSTWKYPSIQKQLTLRMVESVTQIVSLSLNLFSPFHTYPLLPLTQLLAWAQSQVLELIHQSAWWWCDFASSPPHKSLFGVPSSSTGQPVVPSQKFIKSWMKEPRRKPSFYPISSSKRTHRSQVLSHLFGHHCTQASVRWAQCIQIIPLK